MSGLPRSLRVVQPLFTVLFIFSVRTAGGEARAASDLAAVRLRQPVAMVCADQGKTVLVANRQTGSLSVIDAESRRVVAEHEVGRRLADLALLKEGRCLLAADETSNELLLMNYRNRAPRVIGRLPVSPTPV